MSSISFFSRILHVCGGDPILLLTISTSKLYSPRMWRWSRSSCYSSLLFNVFSTYVEVILFLGVKVWLGNCILHVCGGDPELKNRNRANKEYSPRMWRWSSPISGLSVACPVFSTYVEVIPKGGFKTKASASILHVCGGDPIRIEWLSLILEYSPRMWRWSYLSEWSYLKTDVFSTYVEVILWQYEEWMVLQCILHVCGGDPERRG